MTRKLRLEEEGGCYHVINRGNYRDFIFKEALETPLPNLVKGMRWLQSTFAARFNRYRRDSGHLFQGRCKSLIVDPGDGLGALCHYIHLNPVRAKLCAVDDLSQWPWTSMKWMFQARKRPVWYSPSVALGHAGGLPDTPKGRSLYVDYLRWLAEDEPSRKSMNFDRMSKGWVIGSKAFKKAVMKDYKEAEAKFELGDREMAEIRDDFLRERLGELLARMGKTEADLVADGKSVAWKLAVAAAMKRRTTASNGWLAESLHMGNMHEVSRKVNAWLRDPDKRLLKKFGLTPNPKVFSDLPPPLTPRPE